jgi:hypothetical protein
MYFVSDTERKELEFSSSSKVNDILLKISKYKEMESEY